MPVDCIVNQSNSWLSKIINLSLGIDIYKTCKWKLKY